MVLILRSLSTPLAIPAGLALAGLALTGLALTGSACVTLEDRCEGVRCDGETEVCLDLAEGPICVCNSEHEASDTGGCVALEPDAAGSDG